MGFFDDVLDGLHQMVSGGESSGCSQYGNMKNVRAPEPEKDLTDFFGGIIMNIFESKD